VHLSVSLDILEDGSILVADFEGSIAEMAGGWGNHIMQDEPSFIVLEGL
jgi:hypothetical protein